MFSHKVVVFEFMCITCTGENMNCMQISVLCVKVNNLGLRNSHQPTC